MNPGAASPERPKRVPEHRVPSVRVSGRPTARPVLDAIGAATEFGDAFPAPLALVSVTDTLRYVNNAFAQALGSSADDLVGRTLGDLLGDTSYRLTTTLAAIAESGDAVSGLRIVGERVWEVTAWPISTASGAGRMVAVQIHDITEREEFESYREAKIAEIRQINERLIQASLRERELAELADSALAAKANFLAVMSHELRTPLTAIIAYADLLQSWLLTKGQEPQREHVNRISLAAWSLLELVDQILAYARIETGEETLQPQVFDAADVLREAVMLVEPCARSKRLRIHSSLHMRPFALYTDKSKLRQILINLLTNAVKFTDRGRIEIRLRRDRDSVVYEVADTGIGIAADDIERIFEPFHQVEQTSTRREGGTGLGLSLSRQLAALLGGAIVVESACEKGSTFTLRLPVKLDPPIPALE
jgi:PAS domain S-box-containing protein